MRSRSKWCIREKKFLGSIVNSGTNYVSGCIGWAKRLSPLAMSTVEQTIIAVIAAAIGLPPNRNL